MFKSQFQCELKGKIKEKGFLFFFWYNIEVIIFQQKKKVQTCFKHAFIQEKTKGFIY